MKNRALLFWMALFAFGCGSSEVVFRPPGENASVRLLEGEVVRGELVAMTEDSLFYLADGVHSIPFSSIAMVEIDHTSSREWVYPVILLQGIPTVVLFAVAPVAGFIGLLDTGLTVLLFETSEPKFTFEKPWDKKNRSTMSLYFRHPYRLPDDKLNILTHPYATAQ
jgi:hypothetical protein